MAIVAADLKAWASVATPEDDSSTSGGIIQDDAHASGGVKIAFTDISAADTVEVLSDGADTRTVTVTGRLASGAIDTDAIVLSGATPVAGAKTFKNILKIVLSAKDASRTVTVRKALDDVTIATLEPNVIAVRRLFYNASVPASGSTVRYELIYLKNTHGTLSLLAAKVKLTSDPAAKLKIGIATAAGDVSSVTNRLTAPTVSGAGFVDDNVALDHPGPDQAAGGRIAVWLQQTLTAGDSAVESTWTIQHYGNTAA